MESVERCESGSDQLAERVSDEPDPVEAENERICQLAYANELPPVSLRTLAGDDDLTGLVEC